MKRMKKLASLLLAIVMVLSMTVAAFAEGETSGTTEKHSITITNTKSGHTYEAYQVFSGVFFEDEINNKKKLSNIDWGTGVNGSDILAALKETTDANLQGKFSECATAEDVSDVLNEFGNNSAALDAFAEIVGKNLTSTKHESKGNADGTYKIENLDDGYYLVKDKDQSLVDNQGNAIKGDAYTKYIMYVVDNVTVAAKADAPELTKKIVETETKTEKDETTGEETTKTSDVLVDANSASVGDTVKYEIESNVPNMTGYEKYYFIVHDTLSKGLTYDGETSNLKIEMNPGIEQEDGTTKTTLVKDVDYTVTPSTYDATTGTDITIIFKNFIQYKNNSGAKIKISYLATINKNAEIGLDGNSNEAKLQYSNNPNVQDDGDKDNEDIPKDPNVTGETPKDIVLTYIVGLDLLKVADIKDGFPLKDAQFQITGTKVNKYATLTWGFEEATDGDYYKLKDGTYTKKAPIPAIEGETTGTEDKYESTKTKYKKAEVPNKTWSDEKVDVDTFGTVGDDGVLRFDGLGEGTYYIHEIKAPNGYNILKEDIEVIITCKLPTKTVDGKEQISVTDGTEKASWDYDVNYVEQDAKHKYISDLTNGTFDKDSQLARIAITVVNKSGALLPSTGGIGTTIFYAAGIILMAGAVFFVVRRKKA